MDEVMIMPKKMVVKMKIYNIDNLIQVFFPFFG